MGTILCWLHVGTICTTGSGSCDSVSSAHLQALKSRPSLNLCLFPQAPTRVPQWSSFHELPGQHVFWQIPPVEVPGEVRWCSSITQNPSCSFAKLMLTWMEFSCTLLFQAISDQRHLQTIPDPWQGRLRRGREMIGSHRGCFWCGALQKALGSRRHRIHDYQISDHLTGVVITYF